MNDNALSDVDFAAMGDATRALKKHQDTLKAMARRGEIFPSLYFLGNLSDVAVHNQLRTATFFSAFFPQGGGQEYIRLAFSYESAEKCYEGARVIGRAILAAKVR